MGAAFSSLFLWWSYSIVSSPVAIADSWYNTSIKITISLKNLILQHSVMVQHPAIKTKIDTDRCLVY